MPQRILLIQSDATNATTVREALTNANGDSFAIDWVSSCAEGLERLTGDGTRGPKGTAAVVLDLFLPDSQGLATFDRVLLAAPSIPILILSQPQNEEVARLAVQRGAQDYLLMSRLDSYQLSKAVVNMINRAANVEALFEEKERAQVTLNSIGDAVMSTDVAGQVTYLNAVAEGLTGWTREEATGHSVKEVFHIVDAATRQVIQHPIAVAIREDKTVGLTPNCVLIRRDGREAGIEDSAAPIHDRRGRVTGAVMVFHDVSDVRALSAKMAYLAQHDSLTDLPNRILLTDRLAQAMFMARRNQRKLAVLYVDVDRFKHINDSLGHTVGDQLLQSIGERLVASVRSSDTVSRQGGDEFVIVLSEVSNAEDAAICAEKIALAVSKPHHIEEADLHVTVSIGIATYPVDGADAETLLKNADVAMYHAKDAGRGTFQFFKADMNARSVERQSVENGLRYALERRELVLHFQPKIRLETGAIIGAEALIRWHHPQRGLVAPAQFIPIAEDSGLIVPIGRWVLREACRQARAWQDAGLPPLRIAVNTSAVELRAKDFVSSVRAILTETRLEPHYLELELTETFLMQDFAATTNVLQALKRVGVYIALDDFGTGYSSLSNLKRFPIDTLKIDRSFLADVCIDADDASIVSAVLSMGESLGMNVVAEGVETQAQLAFLQEQGCREGQGYYFGRPLAAAEFSQFLKRGLEQTAGACFRGMATTLAALG